MDQTINETMEEKLYKKNIEKTITAWDEQSKKGFKTSGNIIGKDGSVFYMDNGVLRLRANPKLTKFVTSKVREQGLLDSMDTSIVSQALETSDAFVQEM